MIRVMLVEDSDTQRALLVRVMEQSGDIEVVAEATDADTAVRETARLKPDVVTMDLDLPGGGQAAIARIMKETPTPVLVLSGVIDNAGAAPAVAALAAGAVDALPKPSSWTDEAADELRRHLRMVAGVPVIGRRRTQPAGPPRRSRAGAVVALVASTGGPAALATLLRALPPVRAPVLVVQHIHPAFSSGFAAWLDEALPVPVAMAQHGAPAEPGHVYVAPGERHLRLAPGMRLALDADPPALHRPSGDVLLRSLAEHAGPAGVGVVLTGMGDDGAEGLLALRRAGGRTFAQDRDTSTVFGMPQAAEQRGAAELLLPLERLAAAVARAVR